MTFEETIVHLFLRLYYYTSLNINTSMESNKLIDHLFILREDCELSGKKKVQHL